MPRVRLFLSFMCMPLAGCLYVSDSWNCDICAVLYAAFFILNNLIHICPGGCIVLKATSFNDCLVVHLGVTSSFTSLIPLGWMFAASKWLLDDHFESGLWKGRHHICPTLILWSHTHAHTHTQLPRQGPKQSQGCITQEAKRLRKEV